MGSERAGGGGDLARLTAIMARLRDPATGCPWDVAQSFSTIAPYTIEEAYEVADAIARNDIAALKDELGDLLFQVAFHSRMAEEAGVFAITDVVTAICEKMERRHPHIFGDAASAPDWEALKAAERAAKALSGPEPVEGPSLTGDDVIGNTVLRQSRDDGNGAERGDKRETGALSGVALALPALMRAEKLQRRAARVGFDWPDPSGPKAKIFEEIDEVDAATTERERVEEVGDLIFSVVNWARHLGVEPEAALRAANAKFEARFAAMEQAAGAAFSGMSLAEMEQLWVTAKRAVTLPEIC